MNAQKVVACHLLSHPPLGRVTKWYVSTHAFLSSGLPTAVCKDIVSFVMEKVWAKNRDWDGFIVGVTQHDPGRNAVAYEYFSPDSPESWVYDYPQPEKLYYLSGLGQSLVTVDGHRFCGIKPNILGLGGIIVSDLISCKD